MNVPEEQSVLQKTCYYTRKAGSAPLTASSSTAGGFGTYHTCEFWPRPEVIHLYKAVLPAGGKPLRRTSRCPSYCRADTVRVRVPPSKNDPTV